MMAMETVMTVMVVVVGDDFDDGIGSDDGDGGGEGQ